MKARLVFLAAVVALALPAAAADRIPVVNEGAVKDIWGLAPGTHVAPLYPQAYAKDNPQVCLAVGYLLNADGHASNFALLGSWESGSRPRTDGQMWEAFAGSASQALAQWQFVAKPGIASPMPVYTSATFVFGPGDAAATGAHCAIPDLNARLAELRHDPRASRLMSRGIFPRLGIVDHRDVEIGVEFERRRALAQTALSQAMIAKQEQDQKQQQQMQQQQPKPLVR